MNRIASLVLLFALAGCSHTAPSTNPPIASNPPTSDPNAARNAQIIQTATTQAVSLGLTIYANEGHRADALIIANKISQMVGATALPYLNGTSGVSSAAVNGFLTGQFVNLPPEAQSIASLAAIILDTYLPAPSANSVLDADQLSYIKASFQGLNDGAAQFSAHPPAERAVPKAYTPREVSRALWFNTGNK